jgi:hypothetical protein
MLCSAPTALPGWTASAPALARAFARSPIFRLAGRDGRLERIDAIGTGSRVGYCGSPSPRPICQR